MADLRTLVFTSAICPLTSAIAGHNRFHAQLHLIKVPMRYLPKSPADREAMLQAIGIRSVDELFSPIPAEYRLTRDLAIHRQMAESEIVDWFKQRAKENGEGYASFLGAGAYSHYRPVVID